MIVGNNEWWKTTDFTERRKHEWDSRMTGMYTAG